MNRLFTKKPADDTKLTFAPMGQKPKVKASVTDVENAADAKLPGDKKEDAADHKKKLAKKVVKKSGKVNPFAQKAAAALAGSATGAAK